MKNKAAFFLLEGLLAAGITFNSGFLFAQPLQLDYSTYLGGTGSVAYFENGRSIAVAAGEAYVTGPVYSTNFPTVNPYQAAKGGGAEDAFISKFSSDGSTLIYSTYLGGSGDDYGYGISVETGEAFVTGYTGSYDFPTVNPYQAASGGNTDIFASKLSSTGSSLIYSTYLGGSGDDYGYGLSVENSEAFLTGYTTSTQFPTVNSYQGTYGGGSYDAFVSRLSSSGSDLLYSTYLGGAGNDYGGGISVESFEAYIGGRTISGDFPTENAFQGASGGSIDAFISRLSSTGSLLIYSTYLGGSGWDYGYGISVESAQAYLTGRTDSSDFPTVNPYQAASGGNTDIFASKLSSTGSALIYSTYLGGSGDDSGYGIAAKSSEAYLAGQSGSTDFPTENPYQADRSAGEIVFVTRLSSDGSRLLYSTYLGGSSSAFCFGIAVENTDAYVTGYTGASDFPTVNPYQATLTAAGDADNAFVSKLDLLDGVIFEEPIAVALDYAASFASSTDYADNYDSYGEYIKAPVETGPDVVYMFTLAAGGDLTLTLTNLSADLDLILSDGPVKDDCVAASWNPGTEDEQINYRAASGTYYAVVDGYQGAIGSYDISITFAAQPSPTPTSTVTATPTPSVTPTAPLPSTPTPTSTPDGYHTPTPMPTAVMTETSSSCNAL